jgi:hypothetical protein
MAQIWQFRLGTFAVAVFVAGGGVLGAASSAFAADMGHSTVSYSADPNGGNDGDKGGKGRIVMVSD